MTEITQETFETKGQYNKYLRLKSFFEKLIELEDHFFMVDNEIWSNPFIDGLQIGFKDKNCVLSFVELCEPFKPKVDITMKEIKDRIVVLKRKKL